MPGRSISKRQEAYLKTLHLDQIGTEQGSAAPVTLDAVEQTMLDMAILFKTTAADELSVKNAVDTGVLADSIQFEAVKFLGGVYSVDINVLDYYRFVNKGVKGTQGGPSSPYAFKNNFVSKSFMLSIRKWLIRHGLKSNSRPAQKNPLGTEKKTRSFTESSNAMAYAVATSIKKKGLKPTGFWDKAETTTQAQMEKQLGNAFAIDIVNAIVK
jgi:hypothetical protein